MLHSQFSCLNLKRFSKHTPISPYERSRKYRLIFRDELTAGSELIPYCMIGAENTSNYVAFKFGRLSETPPGERVITGVFYKTLPESK